MKKNKLSRLAILLLVLVIVAIMLVAGTYAKYTSEATGSDTAKVAKWSIKLAGNEIATGSSETVTIDLFSTVKDTGGSANETDVATGKKIAPGTSGTFDLAIKNESEVNAKYTLTSEVTNDDDIPIEFSVDGGTAWTTTIDTSASAENLAMNETKTINVMWRWAFEGTGSTNFTSSQNDTTDTTLGIAARTAATADAVPSVTVEVTVTATQVD